ncbi:MAG: iron-sulfur cluster insertion protein ErpA [Anaerolineae bacterium]
MFEEQTMSAAESVTQTPVLSLTPAAAGKIRHLLEDKNIPNHGLRVFVSGGGCSGMQYGMAFEAQVQDGDMLVENHGVKLFVDPVSIFYLEGASIDFIEDDLMGGGFKIENPNAVASCGCGHSFRTGQQAQAAGNGGGCSC